MYKTIKADLGSRGQTKDFSRERYLSGLYNKKNRGRRNRTLYLYEVTWPTNLPRAELTQRYHIARAGRI